MTKATLLQTEQPEGFTFGIRIDTDRGQTYIYPDIADHRSDTERLMDRFARNDVSPVHYDDVIRDYILELAFERLHRNGLK